MNLRFSRRDFLRISAAGAALGSLPAFLRFPREEAIALASQTSGGFFSSSSLEYRTIDAAVSRLIPDDLNPDGSPAPGAKAARVADYINKLLGAFEDSTATPFLFAGGPFSDRNPHRDPDFCGDEPVGAMCETYPNGSPCKNWMTDAVPISRLRGLAWKVRIQGTVGLTGEEASRLRANAPLLGLAVDEDGEVKGLQQIYQEGIVALNAFSQSFGGNFSDLSEAQQDAALNLFSFENGDFVNLLFEHAVEGMYGLPEYGGNQPPNSSRPPTGVTGDNRPLGWSYLGYEGDRQPLGYTLFVTETPTGCNTCHDRSPDSNVTPPAGEYCELPGHPVSGPEIGPDTADLDREVLALLPKLAVTLRGTRYQILPRK